MRRKVDDAGGGRLDVRLRDALGIALPPDFKRLDGRATVRADLGADRAAEAVAAGRTLPLAGVISEARVLAT